MGWGLAVTLLVRELLRASVTRCYKMIIAATTDICKHYSICQSLSGIPCLTSQQSWDAGVSCLLEKMHLEI